MVNSGDTGTPGDQATVRVDAPRATTQFEMIISRVGASNPTWRRGASDVSGAFLRGETDERGQVMKLLRSGPGVRELPGGCLASVVH